MRPSSGQAAAARKTYKKRHAAFGQTVVFSLRDFGAAVHGYPEKKNPCRHAENEHKHIYCTGICLYRQNMLMA